MNCPLCRMTIISNPMRSLSSDPTSSSSSSGSSEPPHNRIRIGLERNGSDGVGGDQSELGAAEMANGDEQLVHISVSMDSSIASMISKEAASN